MVRFSNKISIALAACVLSSGINISAFAAPAAHGSDAHAESSGGLPQFDFTTYPSQIFWTLLGFTVFYFVFSKKILPKMGEVILARRQRIESDLQQAQDIKEAIEAVRLEYEASLLEAKQKASDLIKSAQDNARKDSEKAYDEFKQLSQQKIEEIEAKAEKEQARILAELESSMSDLTLEIVNKVAPLELKASDIENYFPKKKKAA